MTQIPKTGGITRVGVASSPSSGAPPVFNRYVLFSISLFLIILIAGSVAFYFSMWQIIRANKESDLTRLLQMERIKLEASVERELAAVLKMAISPFIQEHFENPSDPRPIKMAKNEIRSYREGLGEGTSVFWINDTDRLFYIDEQEPFKLDPALPENYWYLMTLNETEKYNFNINFNPDLKITNLWINAPVFNRDRSKPVGILGTGVNLSSFVNAVYKDYRSKAALYFFNAAGEITGASDVELVNAKKNIAEELGDLGANLLMRIKLLKPGEVQAIPSPSGEVAVISIPILEWYAVAIYTDSIKDFNTPMTVIFLLGILVIAVILILSNIFIARLLVPLRQTMGSLQSATNSARAEREEILSSIRYARRIQKNLLPDEAIFREVFADYSVIWKPRNIVGGDIYWIKKFEEGAVLCACDCTGHGTPGALLTMLVTGVFETIVGPHNCKNTAEIIWKLEQRLVSVFGIETDKDEVGTGAIIDGCDLAVIFIAKDGNVSISAGHTNVFVCNGEAVMRIKGQKIFVGEGKLKSVDDIKTVNIPYNPENKFYIASDGLFDQPGVNTFPFGYKAFEKLIKLHHFDKQAGVSEKIWAAFEKHRGMELRVDDFQMITFKP